MLILISHGSRNARWRASVEELTKALQASLGRRQVRLAYMELTPPTLGDVANEAIRAGTRHIRVLPLFLTSSGHVDRNIRPQVEQLRKAHNTVELELLPPVGQHPLFLELLQKIAVESLT